ncbi:MAG TPA: proline dehydrogenase family protein, partial [Chitinophagales bacterium]|nr:proline dehydrogenase family protein [Chitinophagales bacterium]
TMMQQYNQQFPVAFTTLQMYRHDRLAFLQQLTQTARQKNFTAAVKLVRGAYMEKERTRAAQMGYPSPIQPDKAASDRDFNLALQFCIENINQVAVCNASHNEQSATLLCKLMLQHGIPPTHPNVWFAQLYGMGDHLSFNLAKQGYNTAKYLPYGPVREVIPYLIRRSEENTSVSGQMSRELALLLQEKKRRK